MKVLLLLLFPCGILNAFASTNKPEDESMESSDQVVKFLRRSDENDDLRPRLENRIIRGKEAKKHGFPWMASIRMKGIHFCGGSLISKIFVLSAGHCLDFGFIAGWLGEKDGSEKYMLPLYYVVLGDHYVKTTEPGEQIFGIDRHMVLEYDMNRPGLFLYNDVALIKLNGAATINHYVYPISLPDSPIAFNPGDKLIVAGWGLSKRPIYDAKLNVKLPEMFSNVLKVAQMKVIAIEDCSNVLDPTDNNGQEISNGHPSGEDMICTREEDNQGDTSNGDSGSPLMLYDPNEKRWEVVGILSSGAGRSGENTYANVSYFLAYIKDMMKELTLNI